jgi:hypothetical protein
LQSKMKHLDLCFSPLLSRILTEVNGSISMRYASGERSPEGLGVYAV